MIRTSKDIGRSVAPQTAESRAVAVHPRGTVRNRAAVALGLVVLGVSVLTAGAWMTVPFFPVPLTMQTLAVLLVGGLLGPRLGVAAVASYLALGLSGAPVFHSGTGGAAVLLGPTGGYLVGFLPAAWLMGFMARYARSDGKGVAAALHSFTPLVVGAVLAEVAIYSVGVPWLAVAYTGGSLSRAAAVGLAPYLLGDLLKMAVAVGALRTGGHALSRRGLLPF